MGNMSYCRFENTAQDLQDCLDNLDDATISNIERRARARLIRICRMIVDAADDDETLEQSPKQQPREQS